MVTAANDKEFKETLRVGNAGEERFKQWINRYPHLELEDKSADSKYQQEDIDFIITNRTTGKQTTVELKTDTYHGVNLFIELTDGERGNWTAPGWLYKSKAEQLAYYFINGNKTSNSNLFIINLPELRESIQELNLQTREVKNTRNQRGEQKVKKGALLPIRTLLKLPVLISAHQVQHDDRIVNNYLTIKQGGAK